ncbi:hypothetical protein PG984_004748 [Apiospora sp. TS-2023a]
MKLPLELWYEVLRILTTSSAKACCWDFDDQVMLRTLRGLSQSCRDLHTLCAPWWYRKARASTRRPSDPFNCLLINAASHGNVEVLRQAIEAGFAPSELQKAIFSFGLDPTKGPRPLHNRTPLSAKREGTLVNIAILGEAAPHQKVSFLKWLFNLDVPFGDWYTGMTGSPCLLEIAAGVGELEVIKYLEDILPTQPLFVHDPESLFGVALECKAPNDALEYLMRRLGSPNDAMCQGWFQIAIENKSSKCLEFLMAHEKSLGAIGKKETREVLGMALDATLHRNKICNGSIEILNRVLRWSVSKLPDEKERYIQYPIWNFTNALRFGRPRKRRMLAYIIKKLTQDYRVTWTNTSEGGDEPWCFAFLEDCICRQGCLEDAWLKFFKLLYHHTPHQVCRAPESRPGVLRHVPPDGGICRCRRRILEFLIGRGEVDVNGGRGSALGTPLHTFCDNVFRMQSRGWFEGGPRPGIRFREVLPVLAFLAVKGCDVAALDKDGRTANDWLVDGAQKKREEEGQEEWALYLDSRPDLYHFTKRAILQWPKDDAAKEEWCIWVTGHATAHKGC